MADQEPTPLREDDPRVIGPYRLVHRLGVGGMGTVFAAVDDQGRRVAVKRVHPELARDREFRERFRREIALLGRVQGEFVARMLAADPDAAEPWLATEYVPGPTLTQRIAKQDPLGEQEVIGFAAALAEAIGSLHDVNVVHRDLKPSNLILSPIGPRLIDLGIARALDQTSLTRTGMVVGSPGWISPEEYRGDEVGPAADVYGWALLVLYAATGRPPFGTGRPEVLATRVLTEVPEVSGVPAPLDELVRSALAKEPERRPDLAAIREGCRRAWRAVEAEAEDVTRFLERTWVMPATDEPEWRVPAPARRRLVVPALAAMLGMAVLGAGALAVTGLPGGPVATEAGPRAQPQVRGTALSAPPAVSTSPVSTPSSTVTASASGTTPASDATRYAVRARSADGWLFLHPPGWTVTKEAGASGGETCVRPPDSPDCAARGVIIAYGVGVGREINLDIPEHTFPLGFSLGGTYCADMHGISVDQRELRFNNVGHAYEFRKYQVICKNDRTFTAYSAYIRALDSLIIGRRVAESDMNLIVGSFGRKYEYQGRLTNPVAPSNRSYVSHGRRSLLRSARRG